ncbi:MAG TPA: FCD domain-containing protein, partial [Nocardioides sp.]|nr:FCD domain-containing protein [Nocardioides sp.]
ANAAERSGLRSVRTACARPPRGDEALMNLDRRIHHAVYAASHNRFLEQNLTQYYSLVQRIWFLFLDRLPDLAEHVSEHALLLDAVIEARAEDAERIVREHVADFEQTVRAVI